MKSRKARTRRRADFRRTVLNRPRARQSSACGPERSGGPEGLTPEHGWYGGSTSEGAFVSLRALLASGARSEPASGGARDCSGNRSPRRLERKARSRSDAHRGCPGGGFTARSLEPNAAVHCIPFPYLDQKNGWVSTMRWATSRTCRRSRTRFGPRQSSLRWIT